MEHLVYNKESLSSIDLRRIGDLSFFEGPLLVLYEHIKNKHLYLVDWVDRDAEKNRWLIYRVEANDVLKFINNQISLLDLFSKRHKGHSHVVDIKNGETLLTSEINGILNIPKKYIPNEDSTFDREDCETNFEFLKNSILTCLGNRKPDNDIDQISNIDFENQLTADARYLCVNTFEYPNSSHYFHTYYRKSLKSYRVKRIEKLQNKLIEFQQHPIEDYVILIYDANHQIISKTSNAIENRLSHLSNNL